MKNFRDEDLAKRSKIAETSTTVEGSRTQSSKELLLRRGSREESKNREEIEAYKQINNSGEEIKDREDVMRILAKDGDHLGWSYQPFKLAATSHAPFSLAAVPFRLVYNT